MVLLSCVIHGQVKYDELLYVKIFFECSKHIMCELIFIYLMF
jgi:hypothetical protein